MKQKVLLIVLDGVGVGELPDAARYGDEGSNTLVNCARAVGGLNLPNLSRYGLGNIVPVPGVPPVERPMAHHGKMAEQSAGKDSIAGHWELAGLVTQKEFPTYPSGFPQEVIDLFVRLTGCRGVLGNRTASGTVIIQELGAEHQRTGFPIVYTSADSVFQIAAHEETYGLEELYRICAIARESVCVGAHAVGRVIARPFVGDGGAYTRTPNRRDFALLPPRRTVLDLLNGSGVPTVGIGKIDDLYGGRGLSRKIHTKSNSDGIRVLISESRSSAEGLLFVNLVDFDQLYGHRNDPEGFARALSEFDDALPSIADTLGEDGWLFITADHGNDPVSASTDHSREYVPLLCRRPGTAGGRDLGIRDSFADVGRTIADIFSLPRPDIAGESFYGLARG